MPEAFENYNVLPIGIFILNSDYRILFWNRYLENWTGWTEREMIGLDARFRIPALTQPDYAIRMRDVLERGVPAVFSPQLHSTLLECDHRAQSVTSTTVSAIPDPSGRGFLAVVAFQDITDLTLRLEETQRTAGKLKQELARREELERELCRAKEMAEHASRAKTDFLAIVSHEIRTPLHAILGTAELLSDSQLTDSQRQHVEMFQRAGNSLLTIINDILDLTKIESGRFDLEEIEFDLCELVDDALRLVTPSARKKGLELLVRLDPALAGHFLGDPTRIRQILVNLLGNAVKFTDDGRVEIFAGPNGTLGGGGVEFAVSDTGAGIPADKIEEVFEDFRQADSSTTRKYGGTGLGLSIARRLIERMGGRISVLSQKGIGTTFSFNLHLARLHNAARPAPTPLPIHPDASAEHPCNSLPLRILIAEDSEDNQILIEAFLRGCPHRLQFCPDGLSAVEAFRRESFDLILMDVQMPVMDGLEATRRIRAIEAAERRPRVPVVAITASALAHDREATAAAGCDQHISKPLSRRNLIDCLRQFSASQRPAPKSESAPIFANIPEGLEEHASLFLARRRAEVVTYESHLASGEFPELARLAHKLKGIGGGYGFPELTDIGARIEQSAKRHDGEGVRHQLDEMKDYLSRVRLPVSVGSR